MPYFLREGTEGLDIGQIILLKERWDDRIGSSVRKLAHSNADCCLVRFAPRCTGQGLGNKVKSYPCGGGRNEVTSS
jgi:hypothetical protein